MLAAAAGTQLHAQVEPDWVWVDDWEEIVTPPDAFRITTLALRDPHVFIRVPPQPPLPALCLDFTDNAIPGTTFSLNTQIAAGLDGDADEDGFLDASTLLLFRPLAQTASLARLEQVPARCTFPVSTTTCEPPATPVQPTIDFFDTRATGTCLAPLPGTTGNNPPSPQFPPYSPAVTSAIGPCLRTGTRGGSVGDVGLALPLVDVQLGATYAPAPTGQLSNGLIRGFLPESVADAIQIPLPDPPGGTVALSSLLPGGTGFCTGAFGSTRNNKDTYNGIPGWWFYFNFSATRVPYTGP
jgi:hypothetical protein